MKHAIGIRLALAITLCIALALFTGTASSAPPPKDAEAFTPYFPTQKGTKWVVQYGKGGDDAYSDHTYEVTAVEAKGAAKLITVSVSYTVDWGRLIMFGGQYVPNVEKVERLDAKYLVSAEGLFRVANYDAEAKKWVEYEKSLQCLLKLPARLGDKSSGEYAAEQYKWLRTVGKPERIKVGAGTFEAIPLYVESTQAGVVIPRRTYWYAPGMGLIKRAMGDEPEMEMMSFTLPGKQ